MSDVEALRKGEAGGPPARRWWEITLDVIAVLGVVAVLALPAAALASDPRVPRSADAIVALPPLRSGPSGSPLRSMPAFTPGSAVEASVADGALLRREPAMAAALDRQFRAVFGPRGLPVLQSLVTSHVGIFAAYNARGTEYPYRYAQVDPILDASLGVGAVATAKVAATNDLAGLLVLAAVSFPAQYPDAPPVAYALYDRDRGTDACEPQLNVAFLLSTDQLPREHDVATEYRRAARDCPGDPTPLWLLGQYQSLHREPAGSTFALLEQQFPRSALGWSGEADARLRLGYRVDVGAPFSARAAFERAQSLYQRAERLDDDPGLAAGEARADAALGDFEGAVRVQRRALARAGRSGPLEVRLVDYLEDDHRFAEAARVNAASLATGTKIARGAGLFALGGDTGDALAGEDALGPISVGSDRLVPVRLALGGPALVESESVSDVSFIPLYRNVVGVTNDLADCRPGALARDLVLAGQPAHALAAIAAAPPVPPSTSNDSCDPSGGLLPAVAMLERGDARGAAAAVPSWFIPPELAGDANPALAVVLDADQNMWRYAGDLHKAEMTANRWADAEPTDPLGSDRAGEIAYLKGDFRAAAADFATAARRVTGTAVATEELKRGTAMDKAGDPAAALPVLLAADRTASLVARPVPRSPDAVDPQAVLDSYDARLQAGDADMREHEFAAAEHEYAGARAREAQLLPPGDTPTTFVSGGEELFRPEVLENNEALVLVELGRDADALRAIDRAVSFDPDDPVFLANQGFVEEKLGHAAAAMTGYRGALASDPTSFQAANNLGVLLADDNQLRPAEAAFREAIAASPDDASAEFNLGLVLDRMGPAHMLEAQGALAAAARREPELREHDHTLIVDDEAYFSTLDLSKPLPPTWHFATSSKRAPITLGGLLLVLLLFRLVKTFVQARVSDEATEHVLETSKKQLSVRLAGLGASAPGALAVVAVVAVFLYPLVRSSGTTRGDAVLLGVGVAVVTLAFMRLRSAIARRSGVATQHYPWMPAIVVGGAAALVGVPFAPMPATKGDGGVPARARWLGTGLLAALALTLLVVGRFSAVPFATELGAICLVMTTSALIPIEPYDGAFFTKRRVELAIVIALAVVGALVETGVL